MSVWKVLGWFFRSPTGIAGTALAVVGAAFTAGAGFGVFPAGVLGFSIIAISLFISLSTKRGLASLVTRKDRDEVDSVREKLESARIARKSIAALRLTDPRLAAARDNLVLEAGKFLEESLIRLSRSDGGKEAGGSVGQSYLPLFDPEAIEAIHESRSVIDAVLHELDESASERRYGMRDAHPVDDPIGRTVSVLGDKTHAILMGRERIGSIPDLAVRLNIEEELK